tara:strand:+ start:1492 stop:1869 length:378 start_codon:yes stop_codon:yes gene_type:complete
MWEFDDNKDYSIFYGHPVTIELNKENNAEAVIFKGLLKSISKPNKYGLVEVCIFSNDDEQPHTYKVLSNIINKINLDVTNKSMKNIKHIEDFLLDKTNNDIIYEIKQHLKNDYHNINLNKTLQLI